MFQKILWTLEQAIFVILLKTTEPIITVLQTILDLLFGPTKSDLLRKNEYVFRYNVLLNTKVVGTQLSNHRLFLKKFRSVEDISIIENEDVTLYGVEEDSFIFVRTKAGINLYDGDKYPFFPVIQHDATTEVMMVSHEAVFRYMDTKPSRDGKNMSMLYIIGRCGSTLVTQMVHCSGQAITICGPNALDNVMKLSNQKDVIVSKNSTKDIKLMKTSLLLLARDPEKSYFIKAFPTLTGCMPHIVQHAMPGITEMFMYRALKPVLTSYMKLSGPLFSHRIANYFIRGLPLKYRRIWNKIKVTDPQRKLLFNMMGQIHPFYLEAAERKELKSFNYESLMADKEGFCKSLLETIGVGSEHVPNALRALNRDSQGKYAALSRAVLKTRSVTISEEALQWAKVIARDEFGIELEGPDYSITNFPNPWQSYEQ